MKVVDFGLSAHFEDFRLEHDIVGTWVSRERMLESALRMASRHRREESWTLSLFVQKCIQGFDQSQDGILFCGAGPRVAEESFPRTQTRRTRDPRVFEAIGDACLCVQDSDLRHAVGKYLPLKAKINATKVNRGEENEQLSPPQP